MTDKNQDSLLAGVNVAKIVKDSLGVHLREAVVLLGEAEVVPKVAQQALTSAKEALGESFVAEPKVFKQVSEFVSQKTKDSHYSLYQGYVESFNRTSAELDTANRSETDSRHSEFRSLKLDETFCLNATWLHELYFANCFDPHSEIAMDSKAFIRLQDAFATFDDFQKDFMSCAMTCGSGWAICGYNMFLKRIVNTIVSNHSQDVMIGLYPLIVLDMHEHTYFRDYLSDKQSYIHAMMRSLDWNVIEERFVKADTLGQALK